jgi:hypothetical protein
VTDIWLKGRVERVGTVYTPALNLVSEDGKRYEVVGDLTTELAGLEGAKLDIFVARERDGWQLPRVRVIDYKIIDMGGDHPEIGIVRVDGEQIFVVVDAQKTLKLMDTALAKRLKARPGEKVWVVGKPVSNGHFKIWRAGYLGVPRVGAASSQPAVGVSGSTNSQ